MSVASVLCELECKMSDYMLSWDRAERYGNFSALKKLEDDMESLVFLHFALRNNNLAGTEDCYDNCLLNEKLEKYGVSRL